MLCSLKLKTLVNLENFCSLKCPFPIRRSPCIMYLHVIFWKNLRTGDIDSQTAQVSLNQIERRCSISMFLPVGLKHNSAVIFLNAVQQVCLKICYAIKMQPKVFIALFVPFSLTMWGCPQHALSSFNLLLSAHVCVHACTHKHPYLHNHTQRGVPGVGHNYCVYRCLLIMSDRPHNFCSPAVSCALPPTSTPL